MQLPSYLTLPTSPITDAYPELAALRDISMGLRLLLAPSAEMLPPLAAYSIGDATMRWSYSVDDDTYSVAAFGAILRCGGYAGEEGAHKSGGGLFGGSKEAAPRTAPSSASASVLLGSAVGSAVVTEDDVLHAKHLPTFDGRLKGEGSELLIQCAP